MEFEPGRRPGPAWHAETYTEEELLLEYRRECKPPAGTLATGLFRYAQTPGSMKTKLTRAYVRGLLVLRSWIKQRII